jgi:hypothetical protein
MKDNQRPIMFTLGAVAGGLLAAAFLPMAVAVADQYDFTPDTTSFDPTQVEGYPPLINEVTGTDVFNVYDLTSNGTKIQDALAGVDTQTTIGSFTNDDFLDNVGGSDYANGSNQVFIPIDTQIDLANFGGGFENEWIDIPAGGTDPGMSDLLITPFGDFSLFGSFFSDFSTVLG